MRIFCMTLPAKEPSYTLSLPAGSIKTPKLPFYGLLCFRNLWTGCAQWCMIHSRKVSRTGVCHWTILFQYIRQDHHFGAILNLRMFIKPAVVLEVLLIQRLSIRLLVAMCACTKPSTNYTPSACDSKTHNSSKGKPFWSQRPTPAIISNSLSMRLFICRRYRKMSRPSGDTKICRNEFCLILCQKGNPRDNILSSLLINSSNKPSSGT